MNFLLIFPHYISWHYTRALSDLIYLFKSFVIFIWNFFSIQILLKTLFVPFQKLNAQRTKRFDLEEFFSALITNLLMRLVGFFVRSLFIILGIFCFIFFTIFYSVFFFIWLVAPFILAGMVVLGIIGLLKFPQI